MITQGHLFINSFTMKYKKKLKLNRNKKPSVRECTSDCHSYLSIVQKLSLLTLGLDRCRSITVLGFFMYKEAMALRQNVVTALSLSYVSVKRPKLFSRFLLQALGPMSLSPVLKGNRERKDGTPPETKKINQSELQPLSLLFCTRITHLEFLNRLFIVTENFYFISRY